MTVNGHGAFIQIEQEMSSPQGVEMIGLFSEFAMSMRCSFVISNKAWF